jgi:hypothetical protein
MTSGQYEGSDIATGTQTPESVTTRETLGGDTSGSEEIGGGGSRSDNTGTRGGEDEV